MIYRTMASTGVKISSLGMGCMRLPRLPGENAGIDHAESIKMIRHAIDMGVNYFDTAYVYQDGESERVLGEALEGGYREKVLIATKLPAFKVEKYEDMEAMLDEELVRLKTDHVDIYLLHALGKDSFNKMKAMNFPKFLDDMVAKGKIRFPGFSFHDSYDVFIEILNSYDWKECQVQMNLLDEFNQATMEGVREAAKRGIGVIVMEPVRGGALVNNIPDEVKSLYDNSGRNFTPAEWAFRWIIDKPEFMTILSGVSSMEQLDDNIRIFSENDIGCMTKEDEETCVSVRKAYEARVKVGCTGCSYCQPCPMDINIPRIFQGYDRAYMFNGLENYFKRNFADNPELKCVRCNACVKACPQHFATPIPDMLAEIYEESKKYL